MSRLRAAWLLVVLFWTACSEVPATAPTQVMLRIHNQDSALLAQMTDLRVSLYRRDGATWPFRDSTLHSLRQLKWPVEIPILPSSVAAESKDFEVVIEALQGDQVLAETRAVSGFVPGEWRLLEVALFMCPRAPTLPACAPAGCHALECQLCTPLGECAPIERIEPTTQPAFDPNTSQVDAAVGAGSDAELPRPSADASTSADAGTPNLADAGATSDAASSARDAAPGGSVDGGADKPVDAGSPAGDAAGPADPCERAACASEATCAVVGGAARCTCKPEFAGDGGVCTALPPGVVQRGPDPTLASASMQGPYTVMSYTSGFPDSPAHGAATISYPTPFETTPFAAVSIVGGFSSPQSAMAAWSTLLASHGFIVINIDSNTPSDQPAARANALYGALDTLRKEHARNGSPLFGHVRTTHLGVVGWSMGGGGALIAATDHPELKAVVALSPWGGSSATVKVPSLILGASGDTVATEMPASAYDLLPPATPRLLLIASGGGHNLANSPSSLSGEIGRFGVAWLRVFLDGDQRYRKFLGTPQAMTTRFTSAALP